MDNLVFKHNYHNFMMMTTKSTNKNKLDFIYNIFNEYGVSNLSLVNIIFSLSISVK